MTNELPFEIFGTQVAVHPEKPGESTKGGILLPESAQKNKPRDRGYIVAKGPEVDKFEVGDYVVFNPYAGMILSVDEEAWLMITPGDIIARLKQ